MLIGLFAEIFGQMASFRTALLDTTVAREVLLTAGVLCVVLGVGLLVGHIIHLATLKRAAPGNGRQDDGSG